ncbi:hypothetical protein CPter91_3421 [Collimonas pratensis]|uniref:Uncharacterized protein n=1 Tax=Collimonas pratensis TaxID=279113 RepID=A0A127Q6T8_9BURK|nr:hypothetical protein CPter91_3421 [Collimonas pratensis]
MLPAEKIAATASFVRHAAVNGTGPHRGQYQRLNPGDPECVIVAIPPRYRQHTVCS